MKKIERPTQKELIALSIEKFGKPSRMVEYMFANPYLAKSYFALSDIMGSSDVLKPDEKQVVFLTASTFNNCAPCIRAHKAQLEDVYRYSKSEINHFFKANKSGHQRLDVLVLITNNILENQGYISQEVLEIGKENDFFKDALYEIVGLITIKTITNYVNNIERQSTDD